MRKILSLMLLVILLWPGYSQAQEKIYLPLIFKTGAIAVDNKWRIVTPVASSNYVLNPSAETTANFSDVSGATTTRVTTYQKYGLYSYQVAAPAIGDGVSLTLSALTNAEHFVTARVRGNTHLLATIGSATKQLKFIEKIDDSWSLYGAPFSASQANGQTALEVTVSQPGTFYLDGVQVEPLAYWTTYIDGTQDGCEWLGSEHASISQRSALSKAGGRSVDFWKTYKFQVERVVGAGSAPRRLGVDSYAILPGGELNNEKIEPREFTIIGQFIADTEAELHEMSEDLESAFFADDLQLTRIRFNGAKVQKEIAVRYAGGLEGDMPVVYCDDLSIDDGNWLKLNKFTQRVAIQLIAPDPFWYEIGESAVELDTLETVSYAKIALRSRFDGQWDNLGNPSSGGAEISALAEDDTYFYIGGFFTDFDGDGNADYVAKYHKTDETWSAMCSTPPNSSIETLKIGPDGTLYACGTFTSIDGVAASRIAKWNGSSWSAIDATVFNNTIFDIDFDSSGNLYVVGIFTSPYSRIAVWNGSSWSAAADTPTINNQIVSILIDSDDNFYIGGSFTDIDGSTFGYIAKWNGTTWDDLDDGVDAAVTDIEFGIDEQQVYVGGNFTQAGSAPITANRIVEWNGQEWIALGDGLSGVSYALQYSKEDNNLYAGGSFGTSNDRISRWNGYVWTNLDIDLPGSPTIFDVLVTRSNPVSRKKYSILVGFNTSGSGSRAGLVTTENEGSTFVFPKIVIKRSGGTSATIIQVTNEDTAKELLFNYGLLDGETLTIDLSPTNRTIISSFLGSKIDAILANSDFATWALLPGENNITSFVLVDGAPTITAYMLWRDAYSSY